MGVGVTTHDDKVGMKKQSLSLELKSSVHEVERSVEKAGDQIGRGKGGGAGPRCFPEAGGQAGGCPGSYKKGQANSSPSSGLRDKWHKEVKFHLLEKVQESSEKVMESKHSRSP